MEIIDSYSESNHSNSYASLHNGFFTKYGQSFTGDGKTLDSCKFYLKKVGSPTGNAVTKIYAHTGTFGNNGLPTGSPLAASDNFDVSTLATVIALASLNFSGANKIIPTDEIPYFVVLEYSGGDSSNKIEVGIDTSSPTHSGNAAYYLGSWTSVADDMIFYVYGEDILPFTNRSKNSTSFTNRAKNSAEKAGFGESKFGESKFGIQFEGFTNKAKVSTNFSNRAKC